MNETIVIYHGGCRDGFCAAWVVNSYFWNKKVKSGDLDRYFDPNIDSKIYYYLGFHGQEPPDCKDKHVIIVDFCYSIEQMRIIAVECASLIVLDHHKTAEETLRILKEIYSGSTKINIIFDNNKSGAGLAWDYFFTNTPRPWLVDYVEDRDLWRKALEYSDEINSFIACLKFDFEIWSNYSRITASDAAISGKVAMMKTEQYVAEVCKNVYFVDINYPGRLEVLENIGLSYSAKRIPVVNICQVDCSEVLHELCKRNDMSDFSLYWFKRADGLYQYGLRSIGDFDVSNVAKVFGGGGHKNAAGFQLPYLLEELR